MPYFDKSEDWLRESSLLLQARPTSTRITTKYRIAKPKPARTSKKRKTNTQQTTDAPAELAPSATLTLKTFDPVSGACLKYRTRQGAEVGRLVGSLCRLGKRMAALPEEAIEEETSKAEEAVEESTAVKADAKPAVAAPVPASGKKKKKGKK